MNREFPEPKWIVEGLLPEGLTLFAGLRKWEVLASLEPLRSHCVSIPVRLGKSPVERGEALHIALGGHSEKASISA